MGFMSRMTGFWISKVYVIFYLRGVSAHTKNTNSILLNYDIILFNNRVRVKYQSYSCSS
jgi:hypothetical protein